ncbi:MAG: J domain-containing protein [Oscillatoriales cyanobacterium]|nr:MAG: J domain-containing protein [Oscillatoriales cyanobacterium]
MPGDRAELPSPTYYDLLGLHPSADVIDIRRQYRELSKAYHPDTTTLPVAIATVKFQELNQAYAVLSSPDRREQYDLAIGYSRWTVVRPWQNLQPPPEYESSNLYLDPTDRPLSGGELFALFTLGLTFIGGIALVLLVGVLRGEISLTQIAGL